MMKNKHIQEIFRILKTTYLDVKTALRHQDPLQLLIATILSAQCTDERVNEVTKELFRRLKTAQDFAEIPLEELEALIRPTGFFKNKAKSIKGCCKAIVEKYGGEVPNRLEELVKLPGVGRKTANVVLGSAFGVPGIVVDTHVKRLSQRLGLTEHADPVKIEMDLMKIVPRDLWTEFSLQLIFHGRKVCKARKPECLLCPLNKVCPYPKPQSLTDLCPDTFRPDLEMASTDFFFWVRSLIVHERFSNGTIFDIHRRTIYKWLIR